MTLARMMACVLAAPLSLLPGDALDAVFVLETLPGTEQAIGLIQPRDLEDGDRAAVIGFDRNVRVLQPLTGDREALSAALRRAGVRVVIGTKGVPVHPDFMVDLAAAIRKASNQFGGHGPAGRKRAILVFFASEDRRIGGHLDDLHLALKTVDAALYAVVIQRTVRPEPLSIRGVDPYPFPVMTAQCLSRLAEKSGGRIYRTNWALTGMLAETRKR